MCAYVRACMRKCVCVGGEAERRKMGEAELEKRKTGEYFHMRDI